MMIRYAVLLDTVSIQHYIFSGNRLRENTGASFLVEKVFDGFLEDILREVFPKYHAEFDYWKNHPEEIVIEDESVPWEVGYIGGGNALLFFQDKTAGQLFVKEWSTALLVKAPGIVCAVAGASFDFDRYAESRDIIFKMLEDNKNNHIPQTLLPRHGITAECSGSGFSLDYWHDSGHHDQHGWVSSVLAAKLDNSGDAKKSLEKEYRHILDAPDQDATFCFSEQLEDLGQKKNEESHIAIVHIDGNDMAQRFEKIQNLKSTRELSVSVRNATRKAFGCLLERMVDQFPRIMADLGFAASNPGDYPTDNNKYILPLRPILLGGDDFTFVCNGKLGIYSAQRFMEHFARQEVSDGQPLSACAGIAVTKTKFPFHRGYELAEQLCANAKTTRLQMDNTGREVEPGLWLDFHVAVGGFSGTLEEIRQYHYTPGNKQLLFRPFRLGGGDTHDFYTFVEKTGEFNEVLPTSKRMELREVLTMGDAPAKTFTVELAAQGITLPTLPGITFQDALWEGLKTPYFDMIELIKFYPEFMLKASKKKTGGGNETL